MPAHQPESWDSELFDNLEHMSSYIDEPHRAIKRAPRPRIASPNNRQLAEALRGMPELPDDLFTNRLA